MKFKMPFEMEDPRPKDLLWYRFRPVLRRPGSQRDEPPFSGPWYPRTIDWIDIVAENPIEAWAMISNTLGIEWKPTNFFLEFAKPAEDGSTHGTITPRFSTVTGLANTPEERQEVVQATIPSEEAVGTLYVVVCGDLIRYRGTDAEEADEVWEKLPSGHHAVMYRFDEGREVRTRR